MYRCYVCVLCIKKASDKFRIPANLAPVKWLLSESSNPLPPPRAHTIEPRKMSAHASGYLGMEFWGPGAWLRDGIVASGRGRGRDSLFPVAGGRP